MDISYNWLKDLVATDLSADELSAKLTGVGLAVEGVRAHGDDWILDIDLTSNRPDCLSHLGVAREIAAFGFKHTESGSKASVDGQDKDTQLAIVEDVDLCPRFTARLIKNVKVGPSPQWLIDRLESVGERSINNIADITNYVMLELGQPTHAFDYDKVKGNRLTVRRARAGEKITTLDEAERELDSSMLAICDDEKPVAVAGIMGGLDSSITASTSSVLLEVAYFDRANIRATSRRLNLATEASYRFERGVDIGNLERASARAAELIVERAGGDIAAFQDIFPSPPKPIEIPTVDLAGAVRRLTGLDVQLDRCIAILAALGITAVNPEATVFQSPSWRHDLAIEEDLVEEIARHVGFDHIESFLPPAHGAGEYQATEEREKRLRQALVGLGFNEALSYSFIDEAYDPVFEPAPGIRDEGRDDQFVTLEDAVIAGAVRMRATLIPGLLDAVRLNLNHQNRDLKIFEIGKVFANLAGENQLPNEQKLLALIVTGGEAMEQRGLSDRELDYYDAKGALEAAFAALGIDHVNFEAGDVQHLQLGQSSQISIGGRLVGSLGRLSAETAARYKFKSPLYIAEVNLQAIFDASADQTAYRPLSRYPSIVRDVSLVVSRRTTFDEIRDAILQQKFKLCRSVMFVDIYEGKGLAEDERSLTVRLEYRSDEHTLTEADVEGIHEQIIGGVEKNLGVSRRF